MSQWMQVIGSIIFVSLVGEASEPLFKFTSEGQKLQLEKVHKTDDVIWSFKFLPDQKIIFTEKSGNLKIFDPKTKKEFTIKGTPPVYNVGQGGLLDVALHPNFAKNNLIYLSFSYEENNKSTTALGRGILKNNTLSDFKIIFKSEPAIKSHYHFGSRIVFDDKGFLFLSIGERNERDLAQQLNNHYGKILRLNDDGSVPKDNPFATNKMALPAIWSYGHRNPQGMTWSKEHKQLWLTEHGPRGGDEINIINPGKNYGWPVITYGREYYGPKIGSTERAGMEQPLKYYVPSIAPSNLVFYTADKIKAWKGNLFIGALVLTHLNRVVIENGKPIKEERLLEKWDQRIRDVQLGPDQWLYLATDSGYLVKIVLE